MCSDKLTRSGGGSLGRLHEPVSDHGGNDVVGPERVSCQDLFMSQREARDDATWSEEGIVVIGPLLGLVALVVALGFVHRWWRERAATR